MTVLPEAQKGYRGGRPAGSKNYSGFSLLAKRMKEKGLAWMDEMMGCYIAYKAQAAEYEAGRRADRPDPELLDFWMTMMPYLMLKMGEREAARSLRPFKKKAKGVTQIQVDRLTEAEGRKA